MKHNVFERNGKYYSTTAENWKKFLYENEAGVTLVAKNLTTNEAGKLVRLLSDKSKLTVLAIKSVKK